MASAAGRGPSLCFAHNLSVLYPDSTDERPCGLGQPNVGKRSAGMLRRTEMATRSLTRFSTARTGVGTAGSGNAAEDHQHRMTISGLEVGRTYDVKIWAEDGRGGAMQNWSLRAFSTEANSVPTVPAGCAFRLQRWQDHRHGELGPSNDSNGDTINYEVEYGRTDVIDGWTSAGSTTSTSRSLSGLYSDSRYTVRVRATDGLGRRERLAGSRTARSAQPLNYIPTQPTNVRVDSVSRTSATIRWDASTDGDGDPFTYKVQYGKDWSWDGWNPATPLSTTSTSMTISGLEEGRTYDVKIWAEDERGGVSTELVLDEVFTTCSCASFHRCPPQRRGHRR